MEEKNEPLPVLDPEDASWLLEQIAERGMRIPAPVHEGPAFGRGAVQDFNQERVLDRLLVYERRIEHSLYRTMAELRNVRRWREAATSKAGGTHEAGMAVRSVPERAYRDRDIPFAGLRAGLPVVQSHGQDAHATETPDGVTTNGVEAQEQLCETKPIGPGPSGDQAPCGTEVKEVGRGRPTYEEGPQTRSVAFGSPETPDGVTTNVPEAQGPACETKPISAGAIKDGVGYRPIFRRRR